MDKGTLGTTLRASFAQAFAQDQRLLTLRFSAKSGIARNTLLPHRLTGAEGVCEDMRYEVECLSDNAYLQLKDFICQPVELTIETENGDQRHICGIVTEALYEGGDGGFCTYRLIVQDALALLKKRTNSRVFVGKTIPDITRLILSEYTDGTVLAGCFSFLLHRLTASYPTRALILQINETDYDFLLRLWKREGWAWFFQPDSDAQDPKGSKDRKDSVPHHALVLVDDAWSYDQNPCEVAYFQRADATQQRDAITKLHAHRRLQSGSVMRGSWDYQTATVDQTQQPSRNNQGEVGQRVAAGLEDYVFYSPHFGDNSDDFERYGNLRMAAHELAAKCFEGEGTQRHFRPGTWCEIRGEAELNQHGQEERQFVLTRVEIEANNNLPADVRHQLDKNRPEDPAPVYRNRFTAVRRGIALVPYFDPKTIPNPGLVSAIVVGPPGEEIFVDELGRIKVRFLFARAKDHEHAQGAGASGTDRDCAWVRVAQPWTGHRYGYLWTPRINDEVLIGFMHNDPDKPIVISSCNNTASQPAAISATGNLPGNKTMNAITSKMVKGNGINEIVWDDTTREQRIRVATDHASTALNAGYLIHPRIDGKGKPRGEGLEIRTDAYAALRSAKGMHVTTHARQNGNGDHMDSKELTQQLQANLTLSNNLSDASAQHNAAKLDANASAERHVGIAQATHRQAGTSDSRDVAGYSEPILAFSSPAGIVSTTEKTHQLAAGEHLHLSSQQDTNLVVGKRLVMAIKEAWSVFVATSGIQLFAGKGKIEIQAQDDNLEATAKKDIKIASTDGDIVLATPKSLTLYAGGTMIRMADGKIDIHAPGDITLKGAQKLLEGPASAQYPLPKLPSGEVKPGDDLFPFSNH